MSIAERSGIATDFEENDADDDEIFFEEPPKNPGLLKTILAFDLLSQFTKTRKHIGQCNGDCANCPPHHGYCYERWYYGHDHNYGCEFGGNRGRGKTD